MNQSSIKCQSNTISIKLRSSPKLAILWFFFLKKIKNPNDQFNWTEIDRRFAFRLKNMCSMIKKEKRKKCVWKMVATDVLWSNANYITFPFISLSFNLTALLIPIQKFLFKLFTPNQWGLKNAHKCHKTPLLHRCRRAGARKEIARRKFK